MASNSRITATVIGYTPNSIANNQTTTLDLNAAATWLALGFSPEFSSGSMPSLSAVRAYISAITGTLVAADVTLSIYSDSAGSPVTLLEGPFNCAAVPAAAAWNDWTGLGSSGALTACEQYWAVFKNVNATPASNFPTFRYANANAAVDQCTGSSSIVFGWLKKHTTNSGSSWVSPIQAAAGYRVKYSDGSFDGVPVSAIAFSGDQVFSTNESGVRFTMPGPSSVSYSVVGISLGIVATSGVPTGLPQFGLRVNGGAATYTSPLAGSCTQGWYDLFFTAAQTVHGGDDLRVTLAETTNADTNVKYYRLQEITWDGDVNSQTMRPMQGTLQKTYWNGTSWTDTPTGVFPFALILDRDSPVSASGGSGSSGGFIIGGF